MHDFNFFGGGWMMIFWWILIIAVVVVLIRMLMKNSTGNPPAEKHNESPLEILKWRYASGEITKEEFEERKKNLSD
jgi:putative membrane protein